MHFASSAVAAGLLGLQAYALNEALAAHRLALEQLIEQPKNASAPHHAAQNYADENEEENDYTTVDHYYAPHTVTHHTTYEEVPTTHAVYDAYAHDYDTSHSEHVAYRHPKTSYHEEWDQMCGKK